MKIGNKIKKARKAKGLNQTQLAGKLHISRGTMSRIENDKTSVSEDLLTDLHVVVFGDRSGPAYPEGAEKSDLTPGQGGFAYAVSESDYPCCHCPNNSTVPGLNPEKNPCRVCRYNRRKAYR